MRGRSQTQSSNPLCNEPSMRVAAGDFGDFVHLFTQRPLLSARRAWAPSPGCFRTGWPWVPRRGPKLCRLPSPPFTPALCCDPPCAGTRRRGAGGARKGRQDEGKQTGRAPRLEVRRPHMRGAGRSFWGLLVRLQPRRAPRLGACGRRWLAGKKPRGVGGRQGGVRALLTVSPPPRSVPGAGRESSRQVRCGL